MNQSNVLIALGLVLFLVAGCSTLPEWITPARIEAVTRLAAYGSAKALLIKEPDSRPELENARAGFVALESSEQWDLPTAAAIASANGLGWLSSPEGNLALTGGVMFIDLILGKQIELSGDAYARAFIVGARSGLDFALANTSTADARTSTGPGDPTYSRLLAEAKATRRP